MTYGRRENQRFGRLVVGRWVVARLPVIKAVAGLSPTILTDLESSRDGELNDTQLDLLWMDRSLNRLFMLILSLSLTLSLLVPSPIRGIKPLPSKVLLVHSQVCLVESKSFLLPSDHCLLIMTIGLLQSGTDRPDRLRLHTLRVVCIRNATHYGSLSRSGRSVPLCSSLVVMNSGQWSLGNRKDLLCTRQTLQCTRQTLLGKGLRPKDGRWEKGLTKTREGKAYY